MSWLWKGDNASPASFEKALAKLSTQITASNLALEKTRSRGRRAKALWTLYSTLLYLIYTLILILVIGPQDWSIPHYAGLLATPLVVYAIRKGLTAAFDWRARGQQAHLEALQKRRESKIVDLKKATKYDSTQELLQKYGGAPQKQTPPSDSKKKKAGPEQSRGWTNLPPPPTANIPGRVITPRTPESVSRTPARTMPQQPQTPQLLSAGPPEFSSNAFQAPPPSQEYEHTPRWYDRILDVMLGEDEASAKNRLALLCENCRLVNGLAPPGVRSLQELGKWRCSSCHAWNGDQNVLPTEHKAEAVTKQGKNTPKTSSQSILADEDTRHIENGIKRESNTNDHLDQMSDHSEQPIDDSDSGEDVPHNKSHGKQSKVVNSKGDENKDDGNVVTKRVTRSAAKAENDD